MVFKNVIFSLVGKLRSFSSTKRSFTIGKIIYNKPVVPNKPSTNPSASASLPDVPGLSQACVRTASQPVGPGAAKNSSYKNPEYFCYDKTSYFEAEIEILKYRCPQPSKDKPFYPNISK